MNVPDYLVQEILPLLVWQHRRCAQRLIDYFGSSLTLSQDVPCTVQGNHEARRSIAKSRTI